MVTLDTARPETVEPPAPPRRRRWNVWVALTVVVVLVGALSVHLLRDRYVDRYQPIRVGSGLFYFDVTGPREDEVRTIETRTHDGARWIAKIPFQRGGTLHMVFPLFHAGGRPIRITDVAFGPDPRRFITVLDAEAVEVGPQYGGNPLRMLRPFAPFTLEPREDPVIGLRYDFVCQRYLEPGSTQIWNTFDIRFEVLGRSRWARIEWPWRLVLEAPTRKECPPGSGVYGSAT